MKTLRIAILFWLIILNNVEINQCDVLKKNPKIFIIGAGPSGVAAASKLFSNGFKNVTILEAEDRIGGRIYTIKFGDYQVDLGGQWVHGAKCNLIFDLINPLGLLEKSDDPLFGLSEVFTDSLGNSLNEEITKNLTDFFFENVYDVALDDDSPYKSVGEYTEKIFEEKFKNIPEIINNKKSYLRLMELLIEGSDPAESWNEISASASQQYKTCTEDGINNWKNRGFSTLFEILMKRIPDPTKELPVLNNTLLNTEVTSINYSNTSDEAPIIISTTKGQFEADHVIVTISLGVLKEKHNSLFTPKLPEKKVQAIKEIGFGTVAKVILLFDKPFWETGDKQILLTFNFLWNEAERKLIESDPEKSWILGMSSMHTVEHKPNLLIGWIVGKYARAMEALPEEKVFNHTVEHLQRFLGKRYNVTTPLKVLRTRWYSNPHFRGTYSFASVEMVKKKIGPVDLEEPIDQNNLKILFAGEATSKERFSLVDGAVGSGWKAANRLINHYKTSN